MSYCFLFLNLNLSLFVAFVPFCLPKNEPKKGTFFARFRRKPACPSPKKEAFPFTDWCFALRLI